MAKTFPYLEVSGTYREVGIAIGTKFRETIQSRIKFRRQTVKEYETYLGQIGPYLEESIKAFPNVIEEMKGIAEGANVPLEDYFLNNTYEIYDFDFEDFEKGHCTIGVSFNKDGAIIGHNEDWPPEAGMGDDLYILKATVNGTTFLGLNYAVEVPGTAAGINSHGLVQCINSLYLQSQIGVPKTIISRAILECKTLDEAESLILKTKRASGYNHVLVQDHIVKNVEIVGDLVDVQTKTDETFVHTNHVLSPELVHFEKFDSKSSVPRFDRATELIKNNMTKEEMVLLLSDTQNEQYPICNKGTIGSLVIIPHPKEVWVCCGQPCPGEFVKYTL